MDYITDDFSVVKSVERLSRMKIKTETKTGKISYDIPREIECLKPRVRWDVGICAKKKK